MTGKVMKHNFEKKYMVATRCFTYNHAPYIEDSLNGFSIQETSFPVVYIIVDDASTDGAPEILRNWCNRNLLTDDRREMWKKMPYGQLAEGVLIEKPMSSFIFLLLDENHYQTGKSKIRFDYIAKWLDNSKYHALCEGDDYWIDPLKLRKQVEYLEKHSDVAMCYTKCVLFDESTQSFGEEYGWQVKDFYHLFESNIIQTLTTVFRKSIYDEYVDSVKPYSKNWLLGDYPMWLYFALRYKVHLIEDCTGVYRVLKESASHSMDYNKQVKFEQSVLDVRCFFSQMCPNTQELLSKAEGKYHDMLFYEASRCKNLQGMVEYISWKIKQQELNSGMLKSAINNLNNHLDACKTYIQRLEQDNENRNQYIKDNQKLQHKRKKYKRFFLLALILDALLFVTILYLLLI